MPWFDNMSLKTVYHILAYYSISYFCFMIVNNKNFRLCVSFGAFREKKDVF